MITASLPAKAFKIRQFFQRTVEPRRRYFEPLIIDIFDSSVLLELTRDFLRKSSIRDAGRLVDINTQHAAPGAARDRRSRSRVLRPWFSISSVSCTVPS